MTEHERPTDDTPGGEDLGPKDADDATMADAGLGGPPAASATPVGQGDEPGTGSDEDDEDDAS